MAPRMTCECGDCTKCKRRVYMRDYYARNPEKVRAISLASRERNIEAVRARDRARGFRVYDEAKVKARAAVKHALSMGRLTRQPCEQCGTSDSIEAHHDDYSQPLIVRWLCTTHHAALHRRF